MWIVTIILMALSGFTGLAIGYVLGEENYVLPRNNNAPKIPQMTQEKMNECIENTKKYLRD